MQITRQELKEKIQEEITIYRNVFDLSYRESKFIENKNMEEVVKILEEKQIHIKKIGEIEKEIQDNIARYANEPEIKEVGLELGKILKEVLEIEKENQIKLIQEFKVLKDDLAKISETKKVVKSYGGSLDIPYFIDKKK